MKATNAAGCSTIVEHEVFVLCRPEVYIPKAFTPNGDNINDIFSIDLHNAYDYNLTIISRSGEKIFETIEPNKGWDGSFGSSKAPEGIYLFAVKYKTNYHHVIYEDLIQGSVLLIK